MPTIRILAEIRPDPRTEAVLFIRKFATRDDANETGIFDIPRNIEWYVMTGQRDDVKIYKIIRKDIFNTKISSLSSMLGKRQDQNGKWHYSNSLDRIVEILTPLNNEARNSSDIRLKEAFNLMKHRLSRRLEKSDLTTSRAVLEIIESWIAD